MSIFVVHGMELEQGGLAEGKVTKCPLDTCLARGKVLLFRSVVHRTVKRNKTVFT